MKKFLKWAGIGIASLAIILFIAFKVLESQTKKHSPEDRVEYVDGDTKLRVFYNQPSVKGSKIFGGLIPYGEVWRTGANEATTFTTSTNLTIDGKTLSAGTYTLWTIPDKDTWTVIFNEKEYGWGVGFDGKASRDAAGDVLQVKVPTQPLSDTQELFTIDLKENGSPALVLSWEKTKVVVPFR